MRLCIFFTLFIAVSTHAAPMVRVVRIAGPDTIVVANKAVQSEVHLAGIEITDAQNAIAYLTWSIGNSWVMIEDGRVYRSPDGMLVNEDLVRKGYARDTSGHGPRVPATYLGQLDPEVLEKTPAREAKAAKPKRPAATARTSSRPARATRRK